MFVFQQIQICLFTTQLYHQPLAGEKQHERKTSMPVHLETRGSEAAAWWEPHLSATAQRRKSPRPIARIKKIWALLKSNTIISVNQTPTELHAEPKQNLKHRIAVL